MTLVQAWVDSISLFKPKNGKLFVLVTLKSIQQEYAVLLKYWWWLFAIIIACYIVPYCLIDSIELYVYAEIVSSACYQLLLFVALLSCRPSMMPKNGAYFRSNMIYFLFPSVVFLILPIFLLPGALSPIYFFSVLFFIDSDKTIVSWLSSFFNALKMVVYNYPLLFGVGILLYAPVYLFYSYIYLAPLLDNVVGAVLLPITICTYTNIYIKKLHDQFDLYFKQSQ